MQLLHPARSAIVHGLICAGITIGTGVAFAASNDNDKAGMDDTSESQQLSEDLNKYNENDGSLEEESAAGGDTGSLNDSDDAEKQSADTRDGASREAEELSEDVNQYNRNDGSLDEPGASETGPDNAAAEAGQQSAGTKDGASSEAKELSQDIDQYNDNAGSLDEPGATETGPDNGAAD